MNMSPIHIVGGGLAGCEAAWQAAEAGVPVTWQMQLTIAERFAAIAAMPRLADWLLRDGAHTTITTRFPNDAVRRFAAMEDSADWLHRLRVVSLPRQPPDSFYRTTIQVRNLVGFRVAMRRC